VNQAKASTQPQNLDIEASLLGSLLIDSDAFIKIGDMTPMISSMHSTRGFLQP
jgi:replicative DNA helicase